MKTVRSLLYKNLFAFAALGSVAISPTFAEASSPTNITTTSSHSSPTTAAGAATLGDALWGAGAHAVSGLVGGVAGAIGIALTPATAISTGGIGAVYTVTASSMAISYSLAEIAVAVSAAAMAVTGDYQGSVNLSNQSTTALEIASNATTSILGAAAVVVTSFNTSSAADMQTALASASTAEKIINLGLGQSKTAVEVVKAQTVAQLGQISYKYGYDLYEIGKGIPTGPELPTKSPQKPYNPLGPDENNDDANTSSSSSNSSNNSNSNNSNPPNYVENNPSGGVPDDDPFSGPIPPPERDPEPEPEPQDPPDPVDPPDPEPQAPPETVDDDEDYDVEDMDPPTDDGTGPVVSPWTEFDPNADPEYGKTIGNGTIPLYQLVEIAPDADPGYGKTIGGTPIPKYQLVETAPDADPDYGKTIGNTPIPEYQLVDIDPGADPDYGKTIGGSPPPIYTLI